MRRAAFESLRRAASVDPVSALGAPSCAATARVESDASILSFRKRDVPGSGVQHRKPANGNLKE